MSTTGKMALLFGLGGLLIGAIIGGALLIGPLRHYLPGPGPAGESASETMLYTCGMHPQVLQEGPGQCPICRMDLTPVEHDQHEPAEASGQHEIWTCIMCPEVLENGPGQCPLCGMDLIPAAREPDRTRQHDHGQIVTIDPAVVQNMGVLTEPVARRDISRRIRTVGYLDYDEEKMVSVTTKYNGFVEKVFVNYIGQPVSKGDPLFEVYSPELVQTEEELLSALAYARRMEKASDETRSRAQALVDAARTRLSYWDVSPELVRELESGGEIFRTLTITAPASGVVMKRMHGLDGMAIRPGMEALHISDLSTMLLTVEVFEDQLPWIAKGARAEVSLTYFPGENFSGRVLFVEPEISEKTRTAKLALRIPNRDGKLRVGMYATVLFEPVAVQDAITIPSYAVLRTGERNVAVVAMGEGRFAPREVELGMEGDGFVQVLSGLSEGEEVVVSAQFLIDSESNLREAIQKMGMNRPAHRH
jgi:Cu(I)/Ag(I) efflux system membrane fusion protein/cobalt-zinc-cadmium efflux system membrane fusion protein